MTYNDLLQHFGSQGAIARAIGLSQPSVWEWQEKGVPLPRQAQFELITDGALKAERPAQVEKAA